MVTSSRFLAAASALAIGASAAAIRRQEDGNRWLATDYTWGCSPGGCIADFFLLGFEDFPSGAPAFDVECSPVYIQQDWVPCKNHDGSDMGPESRVYAVWAKNGHGDPNHYIDVAHIYYRREDGLYYMARTNTTDFVPQDGGSEFFDIASVVPAPESHLPPVVNADAVRQQTATEQAAAAPTGSPAAAETETTPQSADETASDPVPPAGESIPIPSDGSDSTSESEPTNSTPVVDTPDATQTDSSSVPAQTEEATQPEEPTQSEAPTEPENGSDPTRTDDTPVPTQSAPVDEPSPESETMPSDVVLSQPLLNDPTPSDAVLSQPLLPVSSYIPLIGKIPVGGDGA